MKGLATRTLWSEKVILDDDDETKVYDGYPYLFLNAFPALAPSDVRSLALAGRLLARSIVVYDNVMDGRALDHPTTTDALRAQALQFEAYHLLYQLFPPDTAFWRRFRNYLIEYANACLQEQRFASGERPWQEYTESLALEIAVAKSDVGKVIGIGGRNLAALRTFVNALGAQHDVKASLELIEPA